MSMLLLEKLHGHLALLAVAVCFHPFFALRHARRPSWATRLSGYVGTGLLFVTTVAGWWIYPAYRNEVKLDLYAASRGWGLLFETKEHLAWYALALSVAGAIMMASSTGKAGLELRQPIRIVYTLAAVLTLVVGVMGVLIATQNGFGYGIEAG